MKVECSCGAKYQFELRPEMREHPVQFVCPACGLDASQFVDALVRRELGQTSTPSGEPVPAIQATNAPAGVVLEEAEPPIPSVRLHKTSASVLSPAVAIPAEAASQCSRHPGELTVAKCYICSKPICAKCMDLFGYVCSPLCKAKADSHGVHVPVYEGQKSLVEARRWRKLVWAASGVGALMVALLGVW